MTVWTQLLFFIVKSLILQFIHSTMKWLDEPTCKSQNELSLWLPGCYKPVILSVTFLLRLFWDSSIKVIKNFFSARAFKSPNMLFIIFLIFSNWALMLLYLKLACVKVWCLILNTLWTEIAVDAWYKSALNLIVIL